MPHPHVIDFYCMDKNFLNFSNYVPKKKEIRKGLEWHDVDFFIYV